MRMIEIKCDKCGAMIQVNAELPKCMCQYCGNEIVFGGSGQTKPEQDASAQVGQEHIEAAKSDDAKQTESTETVQDDPHEVEQYKKSLKMNTIIGLAALVLRFILNKNIIISIAVVVFLLLLPLRDANKILKHKEMLKRNGVQNGNIVGIAVLILVDVALWIILLIGQFATLGR